MARVTAVLLRTAAREAMLAAGGRGFVRFLPPGGALLATDANRRCANADEKAALTAAFERAGFLCIQQDGLLALTPGDALLGSIVYDGSRNIAWDSPLHPVRALGLRWLKKERQALTDSGRQLILEVLRLSWQPVDQARDGLVELRARGAVMLRQGDTSGMCEAGAVLLDWCNQTKGGNADEA